MVLFPRSESEKPIYVGQPRSICEDAALQAPSALYVARSQVRDIFGFAQVTVNFFAWNRQGKLPQLHKCLQPGDGPHGLSEQKAIGEMFTGKEIAEVSQFIKERLGWQVTVQNLSCPIGGLNSADGPLKLFPSIWAYGAHWGRLEFCLDELRLDFELWGLWSNDAFVDRLSHEVQQHYFESNREP